MNKKIGILGMGEIGQAISKFYKVYYACDLDYNEFVPDLDVLHICIPYSKNFVKTVLTNIEKYCPEGLVIIHSTVPIGTTKEIAKEHKFTVHSPNRGVHPELYEGIKTFVKYIGADFAGAGRLASEHLESLGIKTEVVYKSDTTEALKLWDTTQYGWNILLQKEIYKWCEENKLNFDIIYTHANNTYNAGYWQLDKPEVIRPILRQVDGGIGGHCVVQNCKLLDSYIPKEIIKQNKKYENPSNSK